jgi:hypothetical protein
MIGGIIRFIFRGDSQPLDDAALKATRSMAHLRAEYRDNANEAAKWTAATAAAGLALGIHLINNAREAIDTQAALARQISTTSASMATMERAGDLAGVSQEKISAASRTLQTRMAAAAASAGAERDALKQLHLQADELAQLPLDQRIESINRALDQYIPKTEQAAIAAQLYGREAGLAISSINPDDIAQAAEEARLFGTALSEIDAAKVDNANDSFARLAMASDGFWKQLAVQASPILQGIGDEFLAMAQDGTTAGEAAAKAMHWIEEAAYFTADAIEGVRRVFVVFGQGAATVLHALESGVLWLLDTLVSKWREAYNWIVETANRLPGIQLEPMNDPAFLGSVRDHMDVATGAVLAGVEEMQKTLMKPLPSEGLRKWVEQAKANAELLANATVGDRAGAEGGGAEHGASQAEMEKLRQQIEQRLEALRNAHRTEMEQLQYQLGIEKQVLADAYDNKLMSQQEFYDLSMQLASDYETQRTALERKQANERQKAESQAQREKYAKWQGVLGDISTLMNTESRKLFEVGKAAAIANAIIDTHAGMSKALAQGGFYGIAMAAAVAAKGFASVSAIRSQQFGSGGGGGGAASATEAVNAASTPVGGNRGTGSPTANTVIHLQGEFFSQGMVRGLIDQLNEANRDGGRITLA